MHPWLETVNTLFGVLTIIGHILLIGIAVFTILVKKQEWPSWFLRIAQNGLLFAWGIALIATLGSLTYSDVLKLTPCILCWFQRIFMYPQVFLLGLAWYRKDSSIIPYSMLLTGVGAAIATYHYILQLGVNVAAPCSAVGYSVSCSDRFVLTFGYITIPLMALTAFLLILSLLRLQWLANQK